MMDIDVSKIVREIGEPTARLIENEDEKKQKKYMRIFSFAFLVIFIAGIVVFFLLSRNEKALAASLTKDVAALSQSNADLAKVEKEANFYQDRNRSLLNLILNNPNWSYVLVTLEDVVPKGITFSRFEVESPSVMRIAGISPDYDTLSKLAVSMSNYTVKDSSDNPTKVFGNVSVNNASLSKDQSGKTTIEFTISFSFVKKINKESVNPLPPVTPPAESVPATIQPSETPAPEPTPAPTTETPPVQNPPTSTQPTNNGLPVL